MRARNGLKLIAALEAFKGVISLLVGIGLHTLAGRNLQQIAETLVSHAHLNPASHIPGVFIHAASSFPVSDLSLMAVGALVYALVRLIEAYGLWHGLVWTEWFALGSGAIYIPLEIYEIFAHANIWSVAVFLVNVLIVWYMAKVLLQQKKAL